MVNLTMKEAVKVVVTNRRAKFEYHIAERLEAGIMLTGTEVKSIRLSMINLKDSFAKFINGELWLVSTHITEYKFGNINNHDPKRNRKLLLNKRELKKLFVKVKEKGFTLIPLRVYLKNGFIKIEIGVCKGKKLYDKRESSKKREADIEMQRNLARYS